MAGACGSLSDLARESVLYFPLGSLEEHLMKAILRTKYGPPDALQFTEVEKPTPKDNEDLIKLRAASVNPLDLFTMRGAPLIRLIPGLRTPKDKRIGVDAARQVESVRRNVPQFKQGHEVFVLSRRAFCEYAGDTQ